MKHTTVLLKETIDGIQPTEGDVILDATLGSGGHSYELCSRGISNLTIVGIDADSDAILRSRDRLSDCDAKLIFENTYHINLDKVLKRHSISQIDKAIFDLGISSNQLEESSRGFTFQKNEPLLMTFQKEIGKGVVTAKEIVNNWSSDDIEAILSGFADERFSRKIAEAIVSTREEKELETTFDLVEVIKHAVPHFYQKGRIHPATKTFQALRIAVNGEIANLEESLLKAISFLKPRGRLAVISFHSIEDRIVKRLFKKLKEEEKGQIITKKPIVPTEEELEGNPRARSAKLRILEKL